MCPFERNWDEKFAKLLKKKKILKKFVRCFKKLNVMPYTTNKKKHKNKRRNKIEGGGT